MDFRPWNRSSVTRSPKDAIATGLVGRFGPAAIAGYGTGSRLEYLLVPIVFGLGGPLVAMVGTNLGAGQPLLANLTRLGIAAGGGWLALRWSGDLSHVFLALSVALAAFGLLNAGAGAGGAWFGPIGWPRPARVRGR